MKQFIVLLAVLPLLLVFVLQVSLDQRRETVQALVAAEVTAVCNEARAEGGFSRNVQERFCRRLAERLQEAGISIAPADITIAADEGPMYRQNSFQEGDKRGLIAYEICVPVGVRMAGAQLFGIAKEENRGVLRFCGTLASELLP